MADLRIIDHVVEANPNQQLYAGSSWRWGPDFEGGRWAVWPFDSVAIKVAFRPQAALLEGSAFTETLNYWRNGYDRIDEQLRSMDARAPLPERVSVPARNAPTMPVRVSVEETLAELNEKARRELDRPIHPEPDGCPAPGTWVRAAATDDDMHVEPIGKWHLVAGWETRTGGLGVYCDRWGRNRNIRTAMDTRRRWSTLLQVGSEPDADACLRCIEHRERSRTI